jgi:hypothetical protein
VATDTSDLDTAVDNLATSLTGLGKRFDWLYHDICASIGFAGKLTGSHDEHDILRAHERLDEHDKRLDAQDNILTFLADSVKSAKPAALKFIRTSKAIGTIGIIVGVIGIIGIIIAILIGIFPETAKSCGKNINECRIEISGWIENKSHLYQKEFIELGNEFFGWIKNKPQSDPAAPNPKRKATQNEEFDADKLMKVIKEKRV